MFINHDEPHKARPKRTSKAKPQPRQKERPLSDDELARVIKLDLPVWGMTQIAQILNITVPKGNHLRNGGHLDGVVTRLQGRLTALPSKLRGIISG